MAANELPVSSNYRKHEIELQDHSSGLELEKLRADLATFSSKLMECEKTENRKNRYFKEFNKLKLF
jgi:hypothetical protein